MIQDKLGLFANFCLLNVKVWKGVLDIEQSDKLLISATAAFQPYKE